MKSQKSLAYKLSIMGATLIFSASLGAARLPQSGQQPASDNTKTNQGDQDTGAMTADHQKMNPADRQTSQQIRGAIVKDKTLSTYSHNIKIITQNGKVTLKGPVRSDEEKQAIEAKATQIVGDGKVTSELEVKPKQ